MFTVKSIHVSFEIWGCIVCLIAAVCIFFQQSGKKETQSAYLYAVCCGNASAYGCVCMGI